MATTHIALLGCGKWGKNILRDLLTLQCTVSVVDPDAERRAEALGAGAAKAFKNLSELSKSTRPQGIVVATPASTHGDVLLELLQKFPAVPLFCEKPLTNSAAQASDLERRAPGHLFVMEKWRYHPGIEALAQIAQTQELGRLIGIKLLRLGWETKQRDVDALWTLLPHDLSIIREILGRHLTPLAARLDQTRPGWADGAVVLLGTKPWALIEASAHYPKPQREIRVFFENGSATLTDSYADHLEVVRYPSPETAGPAQPVRPTQPARIEQRSISTEWPLVRELRAFVEHVQGGPPPKSTVHDATEVVTLIEQIIALA